MVELKPSKFYIRQATVARTKKWQPGVVEGAEDQEISERLDEQLGRGVGGVLKREMRKAPVAGVVLKP